MNLEERAQAAVEVALKKKDWTDLKWDNFGDPGEGAWDAVSAESTRCIRAYPADSLHADRIALCQIWTMGVGDEDESSLWMLGVPAPEEVIPLLRNHYDITVGVMSTGKYVLDLPTGGVLPEPEVHRLLKDPVRKAISSIQHRVGAYEASVRALECGGYVVQEIRLGMNGRPDKILLDALAGVNDA